MRPGRSEQQRVAIRLACDQRGRADVAAGAGPAHHGERLLQSVGILIRHHARQNVGVAARRERHDDLHRARRIGGLRAAQRRRDHQRQSRKTGDCVFHRAAPVAAAARMAAFMVRHENIESKSRASAHGACAAMPRVPLHVGGKSHEHRHRRGEIGHPHLSAGVCALRDVARSQHDARCDRLQLGGIGAIGRARGAACRPDRRTAAPADGRPAVPAGSLRAPRSPSMPKRRAASRTTRCTGAGSTLAE